jgi:hypothetical protein
MSWLIRHLPCRRRPPAALATAAQVLQPVQPLGLGPMPAWTLCRPLAKGQRLGYCLHPCILSCATAVKGPGHRDRVVPTLLGILKFEKLEILNMPHSQLRQQQHIYEVHATGSESGGPDRRMHR